MANATGERQCQSMSVDEAYAAFDHPDRFTAEELHTAMQLLDESGELPLPRTSDRPLAKQRR